MKKIAFAAVAAVFLSGTVFAGGVENKTNLSTSYLRNPSRNTEHERPESAFYNIAGTAFMEDGLYIEAGNQFVIKEYGNELKTGNSFSSYGVNDYYSNDETTVWLYPDFDAVYKNGRWSVFFNFGVYAGGGSLSYSEGTSATTLMFLGGANQFKAGAEQAASVAQAMGTAAQAVASSNPELSTQYAAAAQAYTKNAQSYKSLAEASLAMAQKHSLDVTSITYGGQIGAAYKVLDWLSLSAAFRYVTGTQDMTLKCTNSTFSAINGRNKISYDAQGFGESCVFGIHAKPPVVPNLDLSVQYQTLSRIDYDVSNVKGEIAQYYGITDSTHFRTDLPAVLNLGAGYKVIEPLYLSLSFNYYFNTFAEQDSILSETDYDNSWEIAFGADYRICKYIGLSAGISYGKQGITDDSNSTFNPVLDNIVVGCGVEISPTDKLTFTLSGLYGNYFNADYYLSNYRTELSKDVVNIGVGVTYKFL